MLSALLLLAVWALFLNCFTLKTREANSGHSDLLWSILFGCSLATVSSICLLQINLLPSLLANKWVLGIEIAFSLTYLVYAFSKKSLAKKLISPFKRNINIAKLLIAAGITFLFVFTMLTSAPLNWDSNAYNVARISSFLSNASSILGPSTASARQAIYAVGHDILLYPDISFGILRGLPMVSLLEFCVLLGTLLSIANIFERTVSADKPRVFKFTGLVTTILLFNSHQQVMQALITKNDLAITLLFAISIATGLSYLSKEKEPFSDGLIMSVLFLMLCAAINMKSYGVILLIPTGLISTIMILRKLLSNQQKSLNVGSIDPYRLQKLLIILGISTLISFSIQTTVVHQAWVGSADNRVNSITSAWTNQKGSWSDRLDNSLINSGRILLQGSLFPYTTLKPYLPIGPELKSPINDSIIPSALQGEKGTHGGQFALLYGTNPDMAYPFIGFHMGLILGLLGWCLGQPQKGLAGALFIVTSSGLTFLFFSSALLYQPYISRFMGPVYIPLIPLTSIGVCFLLERLPYKLINHKRLMKSVSEICVFLLGILPLLSSMSLTGYLSRRAGMPQGRSDFHEQYLWDQRGMNKLEARNFVRALESNRFKKRILCSDDGPWSLVPMVLSQASKSYKNNVQLWHMEKCKEYLKKSGISFKQLKANKAIKTNNSEIVYLP